MSKKDKCCCNHSHKDENLSLQYNLPYTATISDYTQAGDQAPATIVYGVGDFNKPIILPENPYPEGWHWEGPQPKEEDEAYDPIIKSEEEINELLVNSLLWLNRLSSFPPELEALGIANTAQNIKLVVKILMWTLDREQRLTFINE